MSYDDGRVSCTDDGLVIHWFNYDPDRPKKAAELAGHGVTVG